VIPSLIGAVQAIQFVAPSVLRDRDPLGRTSIFSHPLAYWVIWMDIAWVRSLVYADLVCCVWIFVVWVYGWSDVTVV
jgi:hypothetical protein